MLEPLEVDLLFALARQRLREEEGVEREKL